MRSPLRPKITAARLTRPSTCPQQASRSGAATEQLGAPYSRKVSCDPAPGHRSLLTCIDDEPATVFAPRIALLARDPPHTLALAARGRCRMLAWHVDEQRKVCAGYLGMRARSSRATAACASRSPLSARVAPQVRLKVSRLCALPSCQVHGGRHLPSLCSEPRCPETTRIGGNHSVCLDGCEGTVSRASMVPLWKEGSKQQEPSKYNPAAWWAFPEPATLVKDIVVPAALGDAELQVLGLQVRCTLVLCTCTPVL